MKAIILLGLVSVLGCDSDLPPQITACDQFNLANAEEIDSFLALNNGLTCDLLPPAEGARFSCDVGPEQQACGMPSGISLIGCNCVDGAVECFERDTEVDRLNEMCGS